VLRFDADARGVSQYTRRIPHSRGALPLLSSVYLLFSFYTIRKSFFVQNPDRIITRSELLNKVCGKENGETGSLSIDNHIVKLRQQLGNDPRHPIHFRTSTPYRVAD
jgi:hypothetical protein